MNCLMRTLPFFFLLWVSCSGEKTSKTQADAGGKDYVNHMAAMRKDKDNAFVTDPGSPFADLMEDFQGLHYYPADLDARVKVQLAPFASGPVQRIITDSKGKPRVLKYFGSFKFNYKGTLCQLPALQFADDSSHYFVMFKDKTNGKETYGGGRYIGLPIFELTGILDFNQAYNPYCHYNHDYACPVVPEDCILPVSIQAGEKLYKLEAGEDKPAP
jgi:uncharacterized protein